MPESNKPSLLQSLEVTFSRGDTIFREGEVDRDLYILISGAVEIRKNNMLINTVRVPDTYLGEMSTLLGSPRTATLVAATDCVLVCVPGDKVSEFMQHSPNLAIKLAKTLAHRLREMNRKYERLLTLTKREERRERISRLPGVKTKP